MAVNINAEVNKLTKNIQTEMNVLDQDIEVNFASSIIYAFSPIAKVQLLQNGNYLITITDKNGTTTAEIPVITKENIDRIITEYFEKNPIIQQYIQEHNISETAHQDIRLLIQNAMNSIPTQLSQLQNDSNFITNFKELLREYNSYYDFPNIPSEEDRNMVFLDKSNGDMYVFGLNNTLTYTAIGISDQDYIYGGSSNL